MRGILTNPRLAGLRVHQGEVIGEAAWPAILNRESFDELQAVLRDPRRKHARPARYLLTGLVCTPEGVKLTGKRISRSDRPLKRAYKGPGVSIDADKLETFVVEYVLVHTDDVVLPGTQAPRTPSQVTELERELDELAALRGQGTISLREWMAAKKPLDARLEAARKQAPPPAKVPHGVTAALSRPGGLRQDWPEMSDDARRRALAQVLDRVVIHPVGPAGRAFDPDRIAPELRH
jgi:hypothetical protein